MDVKAPLLSTADGHAVLQNNQVPKSNARKYFLHPWAIRGTRVFQAASLFWLLYLCWRNSVPTCGLPALPVADRSYIRPLHYSPHLNYTRRELVHLDIEAPAYWPISESLSITESLNICHYSYSWNATGTIRLARGDPEQQYNFMVGVDVAGSSQQAIDSVAWRIDTEHNGMYVRCVEFGSADGSTVDWDATVRVGVTVFVKPHTLHFGHFSIGADFLDIDIDEGLAFETYQ